MKRLQAQAVSKILFVALSMSLIAAGIAQAQGYPPTFTGTFTLTTQVRWDAAILRPGDYTITIESNGNSRPIFALVRDSKGRAVGRFMSNIVGDQTSAHNALLIGEKDGQLRVYSLALGSLGSVLMYDTELAREAILEARAPQTVPVTLAKR